MFRTWPAVRWLALPETGEHGGGRNKYTACSSNKVKKIARIFLFIIYFFRDAEILSGRGPGWTGLESAVSEGQLRLNVVEIKQEGRGGSAVCRDQTLQTEGCWVRLEGGVVVRWFWIAIRRCCLLFGRNPAATQTRDTSCSKYSQHGLFYAIYYQI